MLGTCNSRPFPWRSARLDTPLWAEGEITYSHVEMWVGVLEGKSAPALGLKGCRRTAFGTRP